MAKHRLFDAMRSTRRTGRGWVRTIGWMTNGQPYLIYRGNVAIRLGDGIPYGLKNVLIHDYTT